VIERCPPRASGPACGGEPANSLPGRIPAGL